MLPVPAACPCNMFMLHVPAAYFPYCMPILYIHAACLCCMSKVHVNAGSPCCMSIVQVRATCTCFMSKLYVRAAYSCQSCKTFLHFHAVCWCCMPTSMMQVMSYPISPVLAALSGPSCPGSPVLDPCPGSPVLAVYL
jgi:hypothetical protein